MTTFRGSHDIVLTVQGGLGNQLFEWAFAMALIKEGHTVYLDTVRCRGERPLMIGPLIPEGARVGRGTGLALAAVDRFGLLDHQGLGRVIPIRKVEERGFSFDPTIRERLTSRTYLKGYFQSPKYFESVKDSVRSDLTGFLTGMLTDSGRALHRTLADDHKSVALHVRRGDYVANQSAALHHGSLGENYYSRAIARLDELGLTNRIWFSDDLPWVADNLAREGDLLCPDDATTSAGGEIALMAACSSRVIANSSFSWWAGWLGEEPAPQTPVFAPQRWFADQHDDASHLVPDTWTRL